MIKSLKDELLNHKPLALPGDHSDRQQAAVLVPVLDEPDPKLILTQRSGGLNAHGGEVAWPGGKQDPTDPSLLHTALRETEEEIGLPPDAVEIVGELRPFVSKFGLLVTPYVGLVSDGQSLRPNPGELDAIFAVPVSWLRSDPRSDTDLIARHGESHQVPVYHYDGYHIWGLTAMILRELLVHGFRFDIR